METSLVTLATLARDAARMALTRLWEISGADKLDPGLQITSTAPSSSALMAFWLLLGVKELTTTTGSGWYFISLDKNESPSIRGISKSSVITSGLSRTIL